VDQITFNTAGMCD